MYTFEKHVRDWKGEKGWTSERFTFSCDLRGDCPALDIDSNHDITDILKENGVIGKNTSVDPEMCCFYIYINTEKAMRSFLDRLNVFIENSKLNDKHKCPTCGKEL